MRGVGHTATLFNVSALTADLSDVPELSCTDNIVQIIFCVAFLCRPNGNAPPGKGLALRLQCRKLQLTQTFYQTDAVSNKPLECGNYLWANQVSLLELFADNCTW